MPKITEEQRKKAIREYHRLYRKNNPEKIKKINERYWNNYFKKMKGAGRKKGETKIVIKD